MSEATTRKMAYVLNSLEQSRARLQLKHRQLVGRHATMKRTGHPDTMGQAYLIEVSARLIHVVHEALSRVEIAQRTSEPLLDEKD